MSGWRLLLSGLLVFSLTATFVRGHNTEKLHLNHLSTKGQFKRMGHGLEHTEYGKYLTGLATQINSAANTQGWLADTDHKFTSFSREEASILAGSIIKPDDHLKFPAKVFDDSAIKAAPDSFDARTAWPNCSSLFEIYDQANCGSDYAFAAVEALQDRICIKTKQDYQVRLSAEDLLECCDKCGNGCGGGSPSGAWDYLYDYGVCTGSYYMNQEWCKPYFFAPCSHTGQSRVYPPCPAQAQTPRCYYVCPNRYYETPYGMDMHFSNGAETVPYVSMTTEISSNGPVTATMDLYEDFLTYKSGVYSHVSGNKLGKLSVKILGYGTENGKMFWLAANSWNETWGIQGFFKILRGTNECNIEQNVIAGTVGNGSLSSWKYKSSQQFASINRRD